MIYFQEWFIHALFHLLSMLHPLLDLQRMPDPKIVIKAKE
jgi:hypothetical protein